MKEIYRRFESIQKTVESRIERRTLDIDAQYYCIPGEGYKTDNNLPKNVKWKDLKEFSSRSKKDDRHVWIKAHVTLPKDYVGKPLYLNMRDYALSTGSSAPQHIVYFEGKIRGSFDRQHHKILLKNDEKDFDLWIYCSYGRNCDIISSSIYITEFDENVRDLYYDIHTIFRALTNTTSTMGETEEQINYLNKAINLIDFRDNGQQFLDSAKAAHEYLQKEFFGKYCKPSEYRVHGFGHSHIDVAWLWTIAQTKEKAQRTFANMLNYMEQYPEFIYLSSTPVLYEFVKKEAPELYERIKEKVKTGQWEIEGASWVEPDCVLTSGESLVRQFVYGKRFFQKEFGVDAQVSWIPDSFGFSGIMPQILKKTGVKYFSTGKLSWNDTDEIPYDTFKWSGIDGSSVLTMFNTVKSVNDKNDFYVTYNAMTEPDYVVGAWQHFKNKDISNDVIFPYGFGDGGGGPTEEMIELARRQTHGIPGCPAFVFDTLKNTFKTVDKQTKGSKYLPNWRGELYFEAHRGILTSQAKNKKFNRRSEFKTQNAETSAVTSSLLFNTKYPSEELYDTWRKIMTMQFHDILPGSSIAPVYVDSDKTYSEIFKTTDRINDSYHEKVIKNINTKGGTLVFNPNSFVSDSTVELNGKTVYVKDIPAKGYKVVKPEKTAVIKADIKAKTLENDFFQVKFDDKYEIVSIWDKECSREVVLKGEKANRIVAYEDIPQMFENWEIRRYYKEKFWDVNEVESVKAFNEGEKRGFVVERKFSNSTIIQKIYLYGHEKKIGFATHIDWKNNRILLRTHFSVAINSDEATYDLSYGNIKRTTKNNTSWDCAQFEVPAHKYLDLSEHSYGVSLINDCKYGCDVKNSTISLTLLKSGTDPDPKADQIEHDIVYELCPHKSDFRDAGIIKKAYELNNPMKAFAVGAQKGKLKDEFSLISDLSDNVFVETIKKAEDTDDIIIRLSEQFGDRGVVRFKVNCDFDSAELCDMLENKVSKLKSKDGYVEIEMAPYAIETIKIKR